MISETTFSKKFTSFWTQLLPNANNYIRLVNEAMVESLYAPEKPVRNENVALCNTIAYEIFRLVKVGELSKKDVRSSSIFSSVFFDKLVKDCESRLKIFSHGGSMKLPLLKDEIIDILSIANNMIEYFPAGAANITFAPRFEGLGFLNNAEGDIIFADSLIEVKAGFRNFSVNDIRQLLVYLCLNHYSRSPYVIRNVELYNPRMGTKFKENVERVCDDISALQPSDLYHQILLFVTENNFIELPDT
ncbi:hypothetical protein RN347_05335 [Halomonas sp. PAMB 3264]|uniref:hypothetical protein n=1 Tax=Halomonas sp. PAMB 3264 TaxID=3075222 RepID=UPI0028A1CB9E|nr:hypothetical protein [Halomonas sp. PAMB 3264]WNL43328.1 hypothetical protein RN347_05335 [Halomonas sp. PAMB 3264]